MGDQISSAHVADSELAATREAVALLKAELAEARAHQDAISEVIELIRRLPSDARPIFDAIARSSVDLCSAMCCLVGRYDGGQIHIAAQHNNAPDSLDVVHRLYPMPASREQVSGRVILTNSVVHVPDVTADPDYAGAIASAGGWRSILGVPLQSAGCAIGVITVMRAEPGPFTSGQIALLQHFASQAVIAIENARLFEAEQARSRELQESLEYQTAISKVLGVIARSQGNVQPVLATIVATATRLVGADTGVLRRITGDGAAILEFSGRDDSERAKERAYWDKAAVLPESVRQAIATRTIAHNTNIAEVRPDFTAEFGTRVTISVPLLRDAVVVGVLTLGRKAQQPYTQKQIELIETFSDQAVIAIENARLFDELQTRQRELTESLEYQTAISDVLGVISRSKFDLQPVLDTIVETAARLGEADRVGLRRMSGDASELVASKGFTPEQLAEINRAYPAVVPGKGFLGILISGKRTLHWPDITAERHATPGVVESLQIKSTLGVPLMRDGALIGTLVLHRSQQRAFSQEQIALVETFADQAVIAIENARLLDELQTRQRELEEALVQQTATAEVLKTISRSAFDLNLVLTELVKSAVTLCNADFGHIRQREAGLYPVAASHGLSTQEYDFFVARPTVPSRQSVPGRAILDGCLVHVPDVAADPDFARPDVISVMGVRASIGVPLLSRGEAIGVLTLNRRMPGAFTHRQIKLIETFADQAVIAIENARLLDELQTRQRELEARSAELAQSLEYQTAISDVLSVISRNTSEIQPVFESVLANATRLCGAASANFLLYDGEQLSVAATHNFDAETAKLLRARYPAKPSAAYVSGRAVLTCETQRIVDIREDADYPRALALAGDLRSVLGVPLLRQGKAIGAIVMGRPEPTPYTERQVRLVETFAEQATIAIGSARLLEELQTRQRELEESLAHQTATSDILEIISSSPADLGPVFQAVMEKATKLCGAKFGNLFLYEQGGLRHVAMLGAPPEFAALRRERPLLRPGPSNALARLISTKQVQHIADIRQDQAYLEGEPAAVQIAETAGARTLLMVPMLKNDELVGAIGIYRQEVRPFVEKEISLVVGFARQAVIAIENARLLDELKTRQSELEARSAELAQSLEYQTAISDVLTVISQSPGDLKSVFDAIAKKARVLCHALTGAVVIRDADLAQVGAIDSSTPEANESLRRAFPMPINQGRGANTRAIRDSVIAYVRDTSAPEYGLQDVASAFGYRSILAVPMLQGTGAIGAIAVSGSKVEAFSPRQIALLETFADQAVIAIENARLFEAERERTRELQARSAELAQSLEYQTAAASVLGIIARSPGDLHPVLDSVVQTSARLCRADNAVLYRLHDGKLRFAAGYGHDPKLIDIIKALAHELNDDTAVGRAVRDRQTVEIVDTLADGNYRLKELCTEYGVRSLIGVPLMRHGEPIGGIALARKCVEPFLAREVEIVTTFADQAVIAIENARLLDELQTRQKELTESLDYQTATSEVLSVISRSPNELQPVLDTILHTASKLCEADGGSISRQQGGEFYRASTFGIIAGFHDLMTSAPVELTRGNLQGRTLLEGKVVHILDAASDPEWTWTETQKRIGLRTLLGLPLLREKIPIGVIALARRTVKPFTDRQIELAETFADQAVIAIENARLFDELQTRQRELMESLEYQTAISDVLGIISRSRTELQPVLDAIVATAARLGEADKIGLRRKNGSVFELVASHGFTSEQREYLVAQTPNIVPGMGFLGKLIAEQKTQHRPDSDVENVHTWPGAPDIMGIKSSLGVPLIRDGELIGTLALWRAQARPFTDRQIALVETFADQAVIAIENARLLDELQTRQKELAQSVEELRSLGEVGRTVSSTLDMAKVLQTVLENACRMAFAGGGTIYVYDEASREFRLEAGYNMSEEHTARVRAQPMRLGDPVVGECAERREAVQIEDLSVIDRARSPLIDILLRAGVRAILAVPLLHQGDVIGALVVRRSYPGEFTPETVRLLEAFAAQSAIAVNNARLFEEVQMRTREVQEALEYQTATSEVLGVISSSPNAVQPAYQKIVETACRLCKADRAGLWRAEEGGFRLVARANEDAPEAFNKEMSSRLSPLDRRSLAGRVGLERRTVHIPDIHKDPEYANLRLDASRRSMLGVPLLHQGSVLGVIILVRTRLEPFTEAQIRLVETFADQAVIAINNAGLFAEIQEKGEQLRLASQHKSQFLANMSHELRTPLNAILGYTELMVDGAFGQLVNEQRETLDRVERNGRHLLGLINDVLDLSKIEAGEMALAIDEYSVGSLIRTAIVATEPLARQKGLSLDARIADHMPLGRGDTRRLAQVLLNLIGNAIKFTDRGGVAISASFEGQTFRIEVRDTGPGIAAGDIARIFEKFQQVDNTSTRKKGGTGLGLAISREFVQMHGGTIDVSSILGEGAVFTIILPVDTEADRETRH